MSHQAKESEEKTEKPRTASQMWSRLEKVNEKLAELAAERTELLNGLQATIDKVA